MQRSFKLILLALATTLALATVPPSASAQAAAVSEGFTPPCAGDVWWADSDATFSDFDFWIGTWQVYDSKTGELLGFDDITKAFEGCALRQHWRQLNDRFSQPNAPWRYEGGSFTSLGPDGRWHQTWLDNGGSSLPVVGGLDAAGVMVLESDWLEFRTRAGEDVRVRYRWHWEPRSDDTIHNWGFVARGSAEEGGPERIEWRSYFDILYRRNVPGGPNASLRRGTE